MPVDWNCGGWQDLNGNSSVGVNGDYGYRSCAVMDPVKTVRIYRLTWALSGKQYYCTLNATFRQAEKLLILFFIHCDLGFVLVD